MSFIDKAKDALSDNLDKAKDAITDNVDKIEDAIDKAGDFIDDKTGGKFAETIYKVQGAAQGAVDKVSDATATINDAAGDEVTNAERRSRKKSRGETLYIEFEPGGTLPTIGILGEMGYRVGLKGLRPPERREVLRRTFEVKLIPAADWTVDYVLDCGKRCTEARWNKMRQVLYGLNATAELRRNADMSKTISDRLHDLEWLTDDYRYWLLRNYPD